MPAGCYAGRASFCIKEERGLSENRQGVSIQESNDFSRGGIARNILKLAVPMTMAQLINVMYSIVDRIYIGHIPHASAQALTGDRKSVV